MWDFLRTKPVTVHPTVIEPKPVARIVEIPVPILVPPSVEPVPVMIKAWHATPERKPKSKTKRKQAKRKKKR